MLDPVQRSTWVKMGGAEGGRLRSYLGFNELVGPTGCLVLGMGCRTCTEISLIAGFEDLYVYEANHRFT